ncbi:substrate-binding domain-containing protein [Pseudonocardia endophytica]|uniref:Amino acid/amide ABC transporter substrate-binding protein (HAAT family) n=1 Tax=Pseudonocardia endophytica TaxID=401976 RepID=A0A4R1HYL4_PSEEN|nr:substrate-binding domain-containing protein [Pseudonocardia endophytica]TCK27508.1 amino acid/amide ABC transporter substrate-binding protein (HAAT family) [Pseudonocardia endophytica]
MFTVGLVVPLSGPEAVYGPSCVLCARLAAEELNEGSGVLAEPVRLRIVDGGRGPERVACEVERLVGNGEIDAVVGWHLSAVRQRLAPRLRARVPYVYTALYEGGETTPGVITIGETPEIQLHPGLRWMSEEIGVRDWFVVGNDYVWPRRSTATVRALVDDDRAGPTIGEADFVGLGTRDFGPVLDRISDSGSDGVLMMLVGHDSVRFNRQFAERGLEERCARFSPLMDESMLRDLGPAASTDVFTAAGWFEALPTAEGLGFGARYARRFGPEAPALGAPGESCYEGIRLLACLVHSAGTVDAQRVTELARCSDYHGPRGHVRIDGPATRQQIYMATADGVGLDVLASL